MRCWMRWRALYVSRRLLKPILNLTGSRWREAKSRDMISSWIPVRMKLTTHVRVADSALITPSLKYQVCKNRMAFRSVLESRFKKLRVETKFRLANLWNDQLRVLGFKTLTLTLTLLNISLIKSESKLPQVRLGWGSKKHYHWNTDNVIHRGNKWKKSLDGPTSPCWRWNI